MGKFFLKEFLYNGHLQSLGSVGIVALVFYFLGEKLTFTIFISTYLLFQPIYYFDRLRGYKKDYVTNRARTLHIKKYIDLIPPTIISMVLLYGALLLPVSTPSIIFGIIILIFGFLYPIYFKKLTKYLPLFKNIYVSTVHTALIFYALTFTQMTQNYTILFLTIYIFLEAMLSQILLDTKDTFTDKKEGLKTLPILIGKKKAISIALFTSIFSAILALIFSIQNPTHIAFVVIFLATFILNLYSIHLIKKQKHEGHILTAAKFFMWLCLLLIINI